jgi:hypothetical protein
VPLNILGDVERRGGNPTRNIDLIQEACGSSSSTSAPSRGRPTPCSRTWRMHSWSFNDLRGAARDRARGLPKLSAQYGPGHRRTNQMRLTLAAAEAHLDRPAAIARFAALESLLVAAARTRAKSWEWCRRSTRIC